MSRPASFHDWMRAQFEPDELRDLARHGADAGWSGITYYTETAELYDRYSEDLWDMLSEDAEAFGSDHPLELVASFGGARQVATDAQFKNLLVWYGAERVARELSDL